MVKGKSKFFLTAAGLAAIKKEYRKLVDKKRPHTVEMIAEARREGDLSENSTYQHAREELSFIDGRIRELEEILRRAVVAGEKTKNGCQTVSLGCRVTLEAKDGKEYVFFLVDKLEANPAEKKISMESPLGKALLGKKVGEQVEVKAPAGKITYTIKKIN